MNNLKNYIFEKLKISKNTKIISNSLFNSDINKWKPTSLKGSIDTFYNCELKANNHPDWYKKIHPYNYI